MAWRGKNSEQLEEKLRQMVEAEYLLNVQCSLCDAREGFCFNMFCLLCQIGGLCPSLFQNSTSPHFQHDKIQVFKTSYQYVVRDMEMRPHFDTHLIQKYNSNGMKSYYLRTKQANGSSNNQASTSAAAPLQTTRLPKDMVASHSSQRRRLCEGCSNMFTLPRDSVSNPGVVCSVECLLRYNAFVRLKDVNFRKKARKQRTPTRSPIV